MVIKTLTLGGAAALALAGGIVVATPAFAWTHHHHRMHATHQIGRASCRERV